MFRHVKFSHLPVANQDRAVAFYRDRVGLRVAKDAPYREGWRWIELQIPGGQTRILLVERPDEKPGDSPSLALIADDVQTCHATLSQKGVDFTSTPQLAPWEPGTMYAVFRDSENNLVLISSK